MTEEEKRYAKKIVNICPPDPDAERIFWGVRTEVCQTIGDKFTIAHMGSSRLGVEGQNEIDIYIPVARERLEELTPRLATVFGEPRSIMPDERIRFSAMRQGKHIDLFLINEHSSGWINGLMFESYLLGHPDALEEYRQIKIGSTGQTMQEYYRRKNGFIEDVLTRTVKEKPKL